MMARRASESSDARALVAWAVGRRCLVCRETALLHRVTLIDGTRGSRLALIRATPRIHEFDPGERRRIPRA